MTENDYKKILKDREIKYRASLNLPKDITFGVEIEYENVKNELITSLLCQEEVINRNFREWINKTEIDLFLVDDYDHLMNGEINSPILKDNIRTWNNLRIVLNILNRNNAIITNQCGGHVNIGTQVLGFNTTYWRNFLLLWLLYEKEIYKFSSGEFSKVRVRKQNVIDRIVPLYKNNINILLQQSEKKFKIDIYEYLSSVGIPLKEKMLDVSFSNVDYFKFKYDNRIEFRIPNGSLREEIWQNYINFFAKFLLACKKELDVDRIIYKIKHDEHSVIELADLVFEDNIDKDNFLIQTLKTNKVYKKELIPYIEQY